MYISIKIAQNLIEWPEFLETGQNLTQGGTSGITVSNCMLIRDISAILARMERN